MSFIEGLKDALRELLRECRIDCATVLDYDEATVYGGYCETCFYEETVVDITYLDSHANIQKYRYYGRFGELISDLDRVSP